MSGQSVIPMIAYQDTAAAIDWLEKAFGFRENKEERYTENDGTVTHAEMKAGDGIIMLATPTPDYESPRHHREHCVEAKKWSSVPWVVDGVLVYVDGLDAHYENAKRACAHMLSELEKGEHGARYRVEDLEGHRWMFMQREEHSVSTLLPE
jgi:uncharacterized glyoxalase superfamily protein PhnB